MTLAFWSSEYDVRFGDQTIGSTVRPAITALPNGGYVVGWVEGSTLKIQLFDGFGRVASAITSVDATGIGGRSRITSRSRLSGKPATSL